MTTALTCCAIAALMATITTAIAAPQRYPTPTSDGRERIVRQGTCPSGYVGKGDLCEALHPDTPRAYPKIKGRACPSGTLGSGDYCKSFR